MSVLCYKLLPGSWIWTQKLVWHRIVWKEEGSDLLEKKQTETQTVLGSPNLNLIGKRKYTEIILTTAKYYFKKNVRFVFL